MKISGAIGCIGIWLSTVGIAFAGASSQKEMLHIYVDPANGNDTFLGSKEKPWKSLKRATDSLRNRAGVLHLAKEAVFKEPFTLRGVSLPEPIIIEGNDAVIDLGEDVSSGPWIPDNSLFILDRSIPRHPGNAPWQLATLFIDDIPISAYDPRRSSEPRPGQLEFLNDGRMRVNFPKGTSPETSRVIATADYPVSAFSLSSTSNVIVRNLHTRFAGNDGFNLHGNCKNILLKQVSAFYSGDEGISAHGDVEMIVEDSIVAFNASAAGGIADVGDSITEYRRCISVGNRGRAFFLQGSSHVLLDCVIGGNGIPTKEFGGRTEVVGLVKLSEHMEPKEEMKPLVMQAREILKVR